MSPAEGRTSQPHSIRALIGLRLESAEAGRNPPTPPRAHTCAHTRSHKNPRTCTLIKSARRGLEQAEVIVLGGRGRTPAPLADLYLSFLSLSLSLCLSLSVTPSPHPSVINEQPSACLYVFEQAVPLSSYVKTTSPAGSPNKYTVFQ